MNMLALPAVVEALAGSGFAEYCGVEEMAVERHGAGDGMRPGGRSIGQGSKGLGGTQWLNPEHNPSALCPHPAGTEGERSTNDASRFFRYRGGHGRRGGVMRS